MDITLFRERLKELESESGLNEKNFADKLGVKLTTYRNIKGQGGQGPALSTLLAMFTQLSKVEIEYLIFDDTKLPPAVPGWLSPFTETLENLNEVDQGRVLGALQLLGIIKLPYKPEAEAPVEAKQAAVGGMARSRDGTR